MTVEVQEENDYLVRITYRVSETSDDSSGCWAAFVVERVVEATNINDAVAACASDNRRFVSYDAMLLSASCEAVVE